MRHKIIEREARAMRQAGLDAILSSSPENFTYVTGFPSPTQALMRWRHAIALVTADAEVSLLVVDMEATTIRAQAPEADIAVWTEFVFDCMSVLERSAEAPRPRFRPHRGRARSPAGGRFCAI